MSVDDIIHVFKEYINKKDAEGFTTLLSEIQDDYDGVWDYIFKKVYIHACLKKNQPITPLTMGEGQSYSGGYSPQDIANMMAHASGLSKNTSLTS